MKAQEQIRKATGGLVLDRPFYAAGLLNIPKTPDPSTPRAWIDGETLGYNPAYIETLTLNKTKGLLAHEILHKDLLHPFRRNGRDFETYNRAADFVVNSILINDGLELPDGALYDPRFNGKSLDEVFNILWGERPGPTASPDAPPQEEPPQENEEKEEESQGPGPGPGEEEGQEEGQEGTGDEPGDGDGEGQGEGQDGQGDGQGDAQGDGPAQDGKGQGQGNGNGKPAPAPPKYSDPGQTGEVRDYPNPDPIKSKEAEEQAKIDTIQAAQFAKKHGRLPAELGKYVEELLNPRLPWREILSRFIDTVSRNDYTWTRPNARYLAQGFYLPSLNAPELGEIALFNDVSGSINRAEIRAMVSEIKGILAAYPGTNLILGYCNADLVGDPQALTQYDEPGEIPIPGGGTDFRPPFTWIEENGKEPKALLYFTDGECNDFPETPPDYPVLWILTQEKPTCYPWRPPFGETVFLPPEDRTPEE